MTTLIVILSIAGWLTGTYFVGRQYALNDLEGTAQRRATLTHAFPVEKPLIEDSDHSGAWLEGLWLALFAWPGVLLWWGIKRVVSVKPLMPPTERARLEQIELEQLRQQARKYGLPMGDEKKEGR